jgi:hypothetical protein
MYTVRNALDLDVARRFAVNYARAILKDWAGELAHPGTLLLMPVTNEAGRTALLLEMREMNIGEAT